MPWQPGSVKSHDTSSPWFHTASAWHVMLGELLLDRVSPLVATSVWPLLEKFGTPHEFLDHREEAARDSGLARPRGPSRRRPVTGEAMGDVVEPTEDELAGSGRKEAGATKRRRPRTACRDRR